MRSNAGRAMRRQLPADVLLYQPELRPFISPNRIAAFEVMVLPPRGLFVAGSHFHAPLFHEHSQLQPRDPLVRMLRALIPRESG